MVDLDREREKLLMNIRGRLSEEQRSKFHELLPYLGWIRENEVTYSRDIGERTQILLGWNVRNCREGYSLIELADDEQREDFARAGAEHANEGYTLPQTFMSLGTTIMGLAGITYAGTDLENATVIGFTSGGVMLFGIAGSVVWRAVNQRRSSIKRFEPFNPTTTIGDVVCRALRNS